MSWVDQIKEALPEYAKDTRLNLDAVINRSTLDATEAQGCALAAAMATGNGKLVTFVSSGIEDIKERDAALTASAIASHGGTTKARFEAYSLAASIVGKCHFCVKAHFDTLKAEGYSVDQLRDIGRIAAVMNSVAKVLNS